MKEQFNQKLTKNEISQLSKEVKFMMTIAIMLMALTRDSHLKRIGANHVIREAIIIASKKSGYSYESIHDFVVDTVRLKNLGMNFGLDIFLQL